MKLYFTGIDNISQRFALVVVTDTAVVLLHQILLLLVNANWDGQALHVKFWTVQDLLIAIFMEHAKKKIELQFVSAILVGTVWIVQQVSFASCKFWNSKKIS